MRLLLSLLLVLFSLSLSAAEIVINSPVDGFILRDEIGRIQLTGLIEFETGDNPQGYLGKVTCGTKQATVHATQHTWSIFPVDLPAEGENTLACHYTWNGQTTHKSITVWWIKPQGEIHITSPTNGLILRDEVGRLNIVGHIQFGEGEVPHGNMGRVVCNNKDAAVIASNNYSWTIHNLQLSGEGTHAINCSYTRNGHSSNQTINVQWQKPTGEVFITTPTSGQIIRDAQGRLDLEGHIQFGAEDIPSGNFGKVICGDKQGSVKPNDRTWKISSYRLITEGHNTISCSYTRNGRTSTKAVNVVWSKTNLAPVAQFTISPATGRAPLTVQLDATASNDPDGTIASYSWSFSDGTTAQGATLSRLFAQPGNYEITLTVVDNENRSTSLTKHLFVDQSTSPPIAFLSGTPSSGVFPLTVTFDASLSQPPPGGTIKEYRFDFGNGEEIVSLTPYVNHVYQAEGNYTASVIVQSTDDQLSEASEVLIQVFRPNLPPIAVIEASQLSGNPPLEITFSAAGSSDPDGQITSYSWYFPNAVVKEGVEVSHIFETPGTFEVVLIVHDNNNVPGEARVTIQVSADSVAPSIALTPANNTFIPISTPQFEITHTDESGINLASVKAYMDGVDVTARLQKTPERSILAYTLENPLGAGAHQLAVEVRDNAGNLSQLVYDYQVDLGEISHSYIVGTVLDIDGNPLEGVAVQDIYTAPKMKINVLTDVDGKYKIPFTMPGTYRLSFNKPGFTESVRTITPAILQDVNMPLVYLGEADPITTPVTAATGGEALNATGSLNYVIPPGVLPYDVNVTMTEFTDERVMPGPLPAMSMFTYAFEVRPLNLQLNGVATLYLENSLGFPDGTPIVYGLFDRELGRWLDSGITVTVSDNKASSAAIGGGGFPTGDPNLPGVCNGPCSVPYVGGPPPPCKSSCCPRYAGGGGVGGFGGGGISPAGSIASCIIDTKTGDLSVDHQVPAVLSGGESHDVKFVYHSTQTEPQFFVQTDITIPDDTPPLTVDSTISIAGRSFRRNYNDGNYPQKTFSRALFDAKNADGSYLKTGLYQYTQSLGTTFNSSYATAAYFGGPPFAVLDRITRLPVRFTTQFNERTAVINRRLSSFGAGWGIQGLERLHEGADGSVLWEDGGRGQIYFTPIGQGAKFAKVKNNLKVAWQPQLSSLKAMGGVFYATDCKNNAVYRISASGKFDVVAGSGEKGFLGDGGDATKAQLNCPVAIAAAETGGFYIADSGNHRIRRVTADGKIKTIAHHPAAKPLSVSEDKMRAVYFTTKDGVMLVTPRGELQRYTASDGKKSYMSLAIRNAHQIMFNHDDYPMVVDTEKGRIITLYPEGDTYHTNFNGQDKTLEKKIKPKTVSFDPVLKIYYLLDTEGQLHVWGGGSSQASQALNLKKNLQLKQASDNKQTEQKISAMAYSPELGFAFVMNGEMVLSHQVNKLKKSTQAVTYLTNAGDFDELVKKEDGTFELTHVDGIKKRYDNQGRLIAIIRLDSKNSTYQYNAQGTISQIDFPGGSYLFEYDGRGYLTKVRDSANRVTHFQIDSAGKLVRIENPDGTEKNYGYAPGKLLLISEVDEENKEKQFEYEKGKIIREILPGNRTLNFVPENLQQNQYPVSEAPVAGTPVVLNQLFTSFTNRGGDCTQKATFSNGVVKDLTDCLGHTSTNTVNSDGRIIQRKTAEERIFDYSYNGKGLLSSSSDARGITTYEYHPLWDKVTAVRDTSGRAVNMTYNAQGLLEEVRDEEDFITRMAYDQFGNLITTTNALNQVTSLEYDTQHNVSASVDPLMHRTEYTRDEAGNITMLKDPSNRITQFEFDEFNRLVAIYDPMNFVTSMSYTPKGKIATVTDARQNTTTFEYHPHYEVVARILNPQSQIEQFAYDLNERLTTKTNKDGTQIGHVYDANGQLLLRTSANSATSFSYDKDGLVTETSTPDATQTLAYDAFKRLTSVQSTHAPGSVSYTYEYRGKKASMRYHNGSAFMVSIDYTYNPRKLLSGISANLGGISITMERYWDELGRPETDIYSNGMVVNRQFDAAGRLTYLSTEVNTNAPIARFEYQHSPTGSINQITKSFTRPEQGTIGRQILSYTYDNLDRLISASTDGQFVYDELGNQLQNGGTFNSLNQLLEDNEFIYSYSVNGNLEEKTSKLNGEKVQYAWDNENRLKQVRVREANNSIRTEVIYKYDGQERRISKTVNGVETKYVYDGEDIIAELNADNSVAALYLHGPGIDEPLAMVRDMNKNGEFEEGEVFFYAKDHLNSVHSITDKTGKPLQRYSYSAYGRTKVEKTNPNDLKFIKSPYAFTSREWEEETGDYYYRARYYDGKVGRFLSEDPIGFSAGDTNHYRYVKNEPTRFRDPYGKESYKEIKERVKRCKDFINKTLDNSTCPLAKKVNPAYECREWDDNLEEILDKDNWFPEDSPPPASPGGKEPA